MTWRVWWAAGLAVAGSTLLGAAAMVAAGARAAETDSPLGLALLLAGGALLFVGVHLIRRWLGDAGRTHE